jgi:hypothetical protein
MSEVIAEYKVKVDKAVSDLNKVADEWQDVDKASIKAGVDGQKAIQGVEKSTTSFLSTLNKVAGAIGITFGVQQLISFGKEAVTVAAKAEGIKKAFDKLNSPNLLADLRKATRGTVSDLDLMQKAVQANNFKLPLDKLAQLFQFATNRAIETGESVDYLVESIVLGISRKSIPILDNLGISSVQIQEEMKKTGDFAEAAFNIVSQSMSESGDVADTTATRIAQLTAKMQNFTKVAGDALISVGLSAAESLGLISENQATIDSFTKSIENLTSVQLSEKLSESLSEIESIRKRQAQLSKLDNQLSKEAVLLEGDKLKTNKELREQILKEQEISRKGLIDQNDFLSVLRQRLKITKEISKDSGINDFVTPEQLERLAQLDNAQAKQIRNEAFLTAEIARLTEQRKDANTTIQTTTEILPQITALEEELAILLGKETDAQKKLREELEKIAKIRAQVFTGAEMADGVPVVVALSSTIKGLNDLLKEQRDILNTSPEFSQQYKDASDELDKLKKKLDEFNDDFIDPEKGFPGVSSADFFGGDTEEKAFEDSISLWNNYAGEVSNIIGSISQIQANAYAKEQQDLDKQLEQGLITREQYDRKRAELARKQAQSAKDAQLFQATISTAQAIVAALGSVPFTPANIALSALVGLAGAAQIAAIASTPLPTFAEGGMVKEHGLLKGKSHAQGGIKIEAEGNEYFMPTKPTRKNYGLLEAMRKGIEEQYILKHYKGKFINDAIFNGFEDIGRSAELNNITANLKDHNIIASQDRMRQSMTYGFKYLAKELKRNNRESRSKW